MAQSGFNDSPLCGFIVLCMVRPVPSPAHTVVRGAELHHIHTGDRADLLHIFHRLLLFNHKAQDDAVQTLNVFLLGNPGGTADKLAGGAAVQTGGPSHHGPNHCHHLLHLPGGTVIGEIYRLKPGCYCLLSYVGPVLKIHLDHGAHVVQLGSPGQIFQVRLAEGSILRHKLHIVKIAADSQHFCVNGPGAPKPGGHRGPLLPEDAAQLVFFHHKIAVLSSASRAKNQSGMVITDKTVLMATRAEPSSSSPRYRAASTAVRLAAGIPDKSVQVAVTT